MSETKGNGHSAHSAESGPISEQSAASVDQTQDCPQCGGSASAANGANTGEWDKKLKEAENKYLYLYADFENFKKRSFKERAETLKFGWEPIARELLQSVDNLERALVFTENAENTESNGQKGNSENLKNPLKAGLSLCLNEFTNTLKKFGVEPIESKGKAFDPNFHESIGQIPSAAPSGTIVKEEQKGYTLHGRLLRAARVVLSSGIAS